MLYFDINDKQVECPVSWAEAKTKIFVNFYSHCMEGDDMVKVFSTITGTNYNSVWDSTSEDLMAGLYQAVAFIFNEPQDFRKAPIPKSIKLAGKTVLIPQELHKLTVGQNFHMRGLIATAKNMESLVSIAVAIYLQPLVDESKFDFDRAKEIEKQVLEMNIYDVFPIGFFLLSKLTNYGANGLLSWLRNKLTQLKRTHSWLTKQTSTDLISFTTSLSLIHMHRLIVLIRMTCT